MPKQQAPLQTLTFRAVGDVAAYRAVGFSGSQASTAGQKVYGISPRNAHDGQYSDIIVSGTAVVEAGGGFNIGDSLIVDAQGRAIKATGALALKAGATAAASTAANGSAIFQGADLPEYVFADALEVAAAGQFTEVLLRR
jgi:hypothetical protein